MQPLPFVSKEPIAFGDSYDSFLEVLTSDCVAPQKALQGRLLSFAANGFFH